jgi:phage terminase large subunit GpA-like protein
MFNVKCFHCGKSFAVDEALAAAWLEEHQAERPRYYTAQCHFCRRVIKVPAKQIRHPLPIEQEHAETES